MSDDKHTIDFNHADGTVRVTQSADDDLTMRRFRMAGERLDTIIGDGFVGFVFAAALGNARARGATEKDIVEFVRAMYATRLAISEEP